MADNILQANSHSPEAAAAVAGRRRRGLWLRRGLALLGLALLLWLAWSAMATVSAGLSARGHVAQLQLLAANPSVGALPALHENLAGLQEDLRSLRGAGRPFLWLAPHLGWLPRVGPDVMAGPALLEMTSALADSGSMALTALQPMTDALNQGGQDDILGRAVPALTQAAPQLAAISDRLADAAVWRAQIHGPLSPQLTHLLDRLDPVLPVAQAGLQLAQMAPGLLGAHGPRTYLILAQNNHELRATGGFISGAGIVRFENGRMTDLRLTDSYAVDDMNQPHPDAPRVLAEQMGTQLLMLRDSNWSPDFPISAQVARTLYEQDQGVSTDGAIALDLEAVRLLIGAVAPLQVPGMAVPVTGENVIEQIKGAWERPASGPAAEQGGADWWTRRKDFMGPLMTVALARLQSGQGLHPAALAEALSAMLAGRHLQIAVDDPAAAVVLARQGWDGALRPDPGRDFLAVVDSNLGFNKTNAAIQQSVDYRVRPDSQGLLATLVVTYTHTAPVLSGGCDRELRLLEGSYDDMINRCHWGYMRAYAPANSTLVETAGLENTTAEEGEHGTTQFAGTFVMRPGENHVVRISYRLPGDTLHGAYRLHVRKQAGTVSAPLFVQAGPCKWHSDLGRDRAFECAVWQN